jgi:hypothetical protein
MLIKIQKVVHLGTSPIHATAGIEPGECLDHFTKETGVCMATERVQEGLLKEYILRIKPKTHQHWVVNDPVITSRKTPIVIHHCTYASVLRW